MGLILNRMDLFSSRVGRVLLVLLLLLCLLPSLSSQEMEEREEDYGESETLIMEDPEGLTVVGTPETTQQKKVVTKEEIDRTHAPDLAVLLQETLGLGITRFGPYGNQTDITLRGFDSERIAFLIDGVPVNSSMSGDFDISMIDLASVERIEVIYGGSDSKYNVTGALGGLINIITVKNQEPGLRISGSLSNTAALPGPYYDRSGTKADPAWQDLIDTQNAALSLGLGLERLSITANLFANRAENHFLFTDSNKKVRRRDNNEVQDTGISASLVRDMGEYAKLILKGDFYYGDKNIPTSGFSRVVEEQKDLASKQNLMLDMPRAFRDELSTEASLSHAWHTLDYGNASRHRQHTLTGINRWGWYPLDRLTLRLGGDYRYSYLDSTDIGRHDRHDGGVYLTAEYQILAQLLVIPSIKAVFSGNSSSPLVPVPKLGLVWQGTEALTIKNNYFRSFKLPDFEDLYWIGGGMYGNPDLKPEDGWGADLGAAYEHERIQIEAGGFVQWTADSIHWYSSSGTWRPENVGEGIFFGLDARAGLTLPFSPGPFAEISLSVSYQYLLSYLLSYGYTYASDKRIPYMPLQRAGFSLTFPWNERFPEHRGSLAISGHYEGPRFADTQNLTKLNPYFLLNATINQGISKKLSAFLVLRNILNHSYESFNDYYMPGLTITLGIRMHLEVPGQDAKPASSASGYVAPVDQNEGKR